MVGVNGGPIVDYDCPLGGHHAVPGDDVRVLRIADCGFVIACDCGEEPLSEADEPPHPVEENRHLVNVFGEDPSPEEWLALEDVADGWYDTDPWEPVGDVPGTYAQRRQRFREEVQEIADSVPQGFEANETAENVGARQVECPMCGAGEGSKCQRPSGHTVRTCHAQRVEAAEAAGVIGDESGPELEQDRLQDDPAEPSDPEPLATNDPPETSDTSLGAWSR